MTTVYDSRTELERTIDNYVRELQLVSGDKSPIRRKELVEDINYALQVTEPFKERYTESLKHDIFAVDDEYDRAMEKFNEAVDTFRKLGIDVDAPIIENPHLIEAECVMALVDTLRSLDAFVPNATEEFLTDILIMFFGRKRTANGLTPGIGRFLNLYVHDGISDYVLDKLTLEDSYLEAYLKSIQKEYRNGTDG
jgi:hypothetical protein